MSTTPVQQLGSGRLNRTSRSREAYALVLTNWIDSHPARAFACLTLLYCAAVAALSYVKLLWLDELITVHIARLDSIRAIWSALATGADPNPPLMHVAVMLCRRLFGEHAFAFRLPAMLGYWLGMLALFLFLKRRLPAIWALSGTVILMGMGGFEWSYESRSYAIFFGFAMLAFYCWTATTSAFQTPTRRYTATAGMALALAGGICANYFAVLAFFPVAAAELTRTIQHTALAPTPRSSSFLRHIRWSIWIAFALAASPLLVFRPLIKTSVALYSGYAFNKVSLAAVGDSYAAMVDWIRYPLFGVMILAIAVYLLRQLDPTSKIRIHPDWLRHLSQSSSGTQPTSGTQPSSDTQPLLSLPEAAAVSVFVAYPFLGYLLASLRGGMFSPRFVIPVCFGCAIAGILFAYRTFGPMRKSGVAMLVIAVCWFTVRSAYSAYVYEVRKESFYRLLAHIPSAEYPDQPLVISDDLMVLPVEFYAPRSVTGRLVYPIDIPGIMRDRGEASPEVNFWTGRGSVYKFPIIPLATLQQNTSTYIILTSGREWLVDDLYRHWYEVQPLEIDTQSADTYGFFSPLTHARPVFWRAAGDHFDHPFSSTMPFDAAQNIPPSLRR